MNAMALVGRLIRIAGFLAVLGLPLTSAADLPDFTELVEQNHMSVVNISTCLLYTSPSPRDRG